MQLEPIGEGGAQGAGLVADRSDVDALVRLVAGRSAPADSTALRRLEDAGVLRDGDVDRSLREGLEAMLRPRRHATVTWRDGRIDMWVGETVAACVQAAPAGCVALSVLSRAEIVARFAPSLPAAGGRPELRTSASRLAALLAGDGDEHDLGDAPDARSAARALRTELTDHWRLAVGPGEDAPPDAVLEVVETRSGAWLVEPDGAGVRLVPCAPDAVSGRVADLLG